MQRLVDYESSDESEDVLHTIKLSQQEEVEVSTMVEEGVPLEPIHQGRDSPIPELFDYIQACNCNVRDEGCAPKALDSEENPEKQLKDMGYTQVHILNALKACGKQSNIVEMVDFIQAHYGIEDASCSENKVAERHLIGLNSESSESPSKQLQEMGCSCKDIAKAISVCGENTHVSDLFDFIQASLYPIGDEGCTLDAPAYEDVLLNEMGLTRGHITDSFRACGKQSSTLDIADFIQAHYCNGEKDDVADVVGHDTRQTTVADEPVPKILAQQSTDINASKETMVVERDLIGLKRESVESPSKQLQEMGCSCEDISKAISVCGENAHVSDLFDFIQASQYPIEDEGCALDAPAFEEDVPLNEMGCTQGHTTDALRACGKQSSTLDIADFIQAHYYIRDERKHLSGSPLTFVAREDGPSKSMAKRVKWTGSRTKG